MYLFLFFWAFYTFLREKGLLPKKNVDKKHIFITGAGSGLGRGVTLKFAKRGANLTISDINEAGLQETKQMVKALTGKDDNIFTIKLDVSNRDQVAESAKKAQSKFGHVDILVNNAGIV